MRRGIESGLSVVNLFIKGEDNIVLNREDGDVHKFSLFDTDTIINWIGRSNIHVVDTMYYISELREGKVYDYNYVKNSLRLLKKLVDEDYDEYFIENCIFHFDSIKEADFQIREKYIGVSPSFECFVREKYLEGRGLDEEVTKYLNWELIEEDYRESFTAVDGCNCAYIFYK